MTESLEKPTGLDLFMEDLTKQTVGKSHDFMIFTHCICAEAGKALRKHLLNQTKTSQFQVDFSIHETMATF